MQQRPIPDSYWLLPGKLLAGEYPGARQPMEARRKLQALLAAGVSCFLDLTEADEGLQPYASLLVEEAAKLAREVSYQRLAIRDLSVPTAELMREIQGAITTALAAGQVVYVHCWGGIGRTGTVAGCYLVEQGLAPTAALAEIARLRQGTPDGHRISPETAAQCDFVHQWQVALS